MSAADAAAVAVTLWSPTDAVTAVAISGAESSWTLTAAGDRPNEFDPVVYAELLPWTCPPYTSNAPTSIGPWQVNLSNRGVLPYTNNCANMQWLMASWSNSAQAAHALWQRDGFQPWATYTDGRYRNFLAQAQAAVNAALAVSPPPPPTGGGSTPGQIIARRPSLLFVVLGLLGAAGIVVIGEGEVRR